jgi:cytochrome c oxidase subunit 4
MEQPLATKIYYWVWLLLLLLLAITVGSAYIHLGALSIALNLAIAAAKALLITLFFMHLRDSDRLIWLVAGAGFFWLLMLFSLTLSDYLTRSWLPAP